MKNFKNISLALISLISLNSCSNDDDNTTTDLSGTTQINFDAKVGTADFALNTPFTINGQSLQFERLRYWISDLKLVNAKNETYTVPNSFFLLEETNAIAVQEGDYTYPAKKRESVDLTAVPSGTYTKIIFSVGVDATHNDNMSIQAGELSQLNGMTNVSWMWHTSYIFSALTGKNVTPATPVAISVETGLNTNYRTIEITLPTALVVSSKTAAKLNLNVDVEKIVKDIDLVANPKIAASKATLMTQVADNYKNNVFTVKSVE
jgi:hypothetical protein